MDLAPQLLNLSSQKGGYITLHDLIQLSNQQPSYTHLHKDQLNISLLQIQKTPGGSLDILPVSQPVRVYPPVHTLQSEPSAVRGVPPYQSLNTMGPMHAMAPMHSMYSMAPLQNVPSLQSMPPLPPMPSGYAVQAMPPFHSMQSAPNIPEEARPAGMVQAPQGVGQGSAMSA